MDEFELENLMEQISLWNMDDEFLKIIEAIEKIPEDQRGFELNLKLARFYDKLAVFGDKCCWLDDDSEEHEPDVSVLEKSLALLKSIADKGKDDYRWYSRMAFTLSYFPDERADDAMKYALQWKELEPDDESADELIQMLEQRLAGPEMYDKDDMIAVEEHIGKFYGKFDDVFHEIVSPDIHVDIIMIPPRPGHNYYTLVTMGMGAHVMNVPKELARCHWERAELVINLAPYWQMDKLYDERWYWPFRVLKQIARLPINEDSWVGWGHTVSLDRGENYAINTEFCGCLLISPGDFPTGSYKTQLPSGEYVNFYQLVPLYQDELDYKAKTDADKLMRLFVEDRTLNVTDIKRPSVILEKGKVKNDKISWMIMDAGEIHAKDMYEQEIPVEELAAYNHMAAYLRWSIENNLMSDKFLKNHRDFMEKVKSDPENAGIREYIKDKLNGKLYLAFFNNEGFDFSNEYYISGDPCFPADVNEYARGYLGEDKYEELESEGLENDAYLFLPFNGEYYKNVSGIIQNRFDVWKAAQEYKTDLTLAVSDFLGCDSISCPPMYNDAPIVSAYMDMRKKSAGKSVPMLVSVSEELFKTLLKNTGAASDSGNLSFNKDKVAEYRKNYLSAAVKPARPFLREKILLLKKKAKQNRLDWFKDIVKDVTFGETIKDFVSYFDSTTDKTLPLVLADIPVKNPWEVFAYLPFGNNGDCPDTDTLMSVSKYWYEKYRAVPGAVAENVLEFILPRPVPRDKALGLAEELYALCPDILADDPLGEFADTLARSTRWFLWWN